MERPLINDPGISFLYSIFSVSSLLFPLISMMFTGHIYFFIIDKYQKPELSTSLFLAIGHYWKYKDKNFKFSLFRINRKFYF